MFTDINMLIFTFVKKTERVTSGFNSNSAVAHANAQPITTIPPLKKTEQKKKKIQKTLSPVLLFCLDRGELAALEVLQSSLAKVACLGLVDWLDVPGLQAEACKGNAPTDLRGEGRCQSLFFFSSHEAPGVDKLLDCACTNEPIFFS